MAAPQPQPWFNAESRRRQNRPYSSCLPFKNFTTGFSDWVIFSPSVVLAIDFSDSPAIYLILVCGWQFLPLSAKMSTFACILQ